MGREKRWKIRRLLVRIGFLLIVAIIGSMIWFYIAASNCLILWKANKKSSQPIRFFVTAGSPQKMAMRLKALEQIESHQKMTIQINLDREGLKEKLENLNYLRKKRISIEWNMIPGKGSVWEIQQALHKAEGNNELLVVPLIPERALKVYLLEGNIDDIRIVFISASFSRKILEFIKAYLSWNMVTRKLVDKSRRVYYDYEE
jgi:hypothetical protein